MRLPLLAALSGLALVSCSPAATSAPEDLKPWESVLDDEGLSAAIANIEARPDAPEHQFLIGGLEFLSATEAIMQVRYQNSAQSLAILPGMRNELPGNPDGVFDPAFLETAMNDALVHLARAETALAMAGDDFALEFPLTAIWFDMNQNGTKEVWETGLAVMNSLNAAPGADFDGIIRFDTADAHWLKAYVHVMAGMAELTLAADPTPAIRAVYEGREKMDAIGTIEGIFLSNDDIDSIAAVLLTLRGVPDQARTREAHRHFKEMISENKAFWASVMEETDNQAEWLPNPNQQSAFGIEVTADLAAGWQSVLEEIEALLNGDALVPYWRFNNGYNATEGVGVNLAKYLQDPGDLDIILWLHGTAATPYLERGPLADMAAWNQFTRMTRGDGLMFAVWFN
ncbi:MAG: hypothetical protein AAF768_11980 [Pseudomonadota bacterium]